MVKLTKAKTNGHKQYKCIRKTACLTENYEHSGYTLPCKMPSKRIQIMFCNGGGFLSVKDAFSETGYPAFY